MSRFNIVEPRCFELTAFASRSVQNEDVAEKT